LADRVGQREQGQKKQLMFSRKLSIPKPNKKHITRLPNFLLSLNHYVATPLYIYTIWMSKEMKGMRSRRERKQIPPHCPQDSN
jgi:hypothetical protein